MDRLNVTLLSAVLEYLPFEEFADAARANKRLAAACLERRKRIRAVFSECEYGEETLVRVRFASQLTSLEIRSCKISYRTMREILLACASTLQTLKIDMVQLNDEDAQREAEPRSDDEEEEEEEQQQQEPRGRRGDAQQQRGGGGESKRRSGEVDHRPHRNSSFPLSARDAEEVSHPILLNQLKHFEISPTTATWWELSIEAPHLEFFSTNRKMLEDRCATCNRPRPNYKCSWCRYYAFCDRGCQHENWNNDELHRFVCNAHFYGAKYQPIQNGLSLIRKVCDESVNLTRIDVAHYWKANVLFPPEMTSSGREEEGEVEEAEEDEAAARPHSSSSRNKKRKKIHQERLHLQDVSSSALTSSTAPSRRIVPAAPDRGDELGDEDEEDANDAITSMPPVFGTPAALECLGRLRTLRLLRCGVDDYALSLIATHAPALLHLDLSTNTRLTDAGIANLRSPILKDLRLLQNHRLTERGIEVVAGQLPNLHFLDACAGVRRRREIRAGNAGEAGRGGGVVANLGLEVKWTMGLRTLGNLSKYCRRLRKVCIVVSDSFPVAEIAGKRMFPFKVVRYDSRRVQNFACVSPDQAWPWEDEDEKEERMEEETSI